METRCCSPPEKLTCSMGRPLCQPHFAKPVNGFLHCLFFLTHRAREGESATFFSSRKFGQKIVKLPDVADLAIAKNPLPQRGVKDRSK